MRIESPYHKGTQKQRKGLHESKVFDADCDLKELLQGLKDV